MPAQADEGETRAKTVRPIAINESGQSASTVKPAASAKQEQDQKNNQNRFGTHRMFLSAIVTATDL